MTGLVGLFVAALLSSQAAGEARRIDACRGVAIETPSGRENLVGIYVEGADDVLLRVKAAAEERRFQVSGPSVGVFGRPRINVNFYTSSRDPALNTSPAAAQAFLRSLEGNEFGDAQIRPLVMSIDTLPEDRC